MLFNKPNVAFTAFSKRKQFEKMIETYLAPRFAAENFQWQKEELMDEHVLDIMSETLQRDLLPDEKYTSHTFCREINGFVQEIALSRNAYSSGLMFTSSWSLSYNAYENWYKKSYGEALDNTCLMMWYDNDTNRGYRRYKYEGYYDLSRRSTEKVMDIFWNETSRNRITELNVNSNLEIMLSNLERNKYLHDYEHMLDIAMMLGYYDRARRILFWAEKGLKKQDPQELLSDAFRRRKKLLNTYLSN